MSFSERLKAARAEAGLSQVKLAKATGIPRRTIEAWESEKEAGREPNEWTQRIVLDEIARIRNAQDKEGNIMDALVKIAEENISALEGRGDLESRDNDSEDFFETSVWSLKAALVAAYELGKNGGAKK